MLSWLQPTFFNMDFSIFDFSKSETVFVDLGLHPVNIRNIFKWFKRLQNVFKTYLNPILWFSKRFQENVYTVMFKKHFSK